MVPLVELVRQYRESVDLDRRLALARTIFEAVSSRVYQYIRRRCPREHVDDVCQETLAGISKNLHLFHGTTDKKFWGWCYGVARNKVADQFRGQERDPLAQVDPDDVWQAVEDSAREEPLTKEERVDLKQAMELLQQANPPCYDYLIQVYFVGWTFEDLAQAQGVSYDAARMRVDRCLDFIQELLDKRKRR
jgi:RNA polymerase sigma factor (sigma-70 family)